MKRRQRYRCYPADGSKSHDFTPPLPRLAVDFGHEHCDACQALVGVHRGEQASARKHPSLLSVVVDTLESVATGTSYAKASVAARERLGGYTPRRSGGQSGRQRASQRTGTATSGSRRVSEAAKKHRNHWHIAADWTEIYSPVCWRETLTQMRQEEAEQALNPDPERPRVLLIDALPVQGKKGKGVSRRAWYVLGAAQVRWSTERAVSQRTVLRQVRAMPLEDRIAWRVFFDELDPYQPDYVVADLGTAQVRAVRETWPDAVIIPSLYHLLRNLEHDLFLTAGSTEKNENNVTVLKPDVDRHLHTMSGVAIVQMSLADWQQWWDDLRTILRTLGCSTTRITKRFNRLTPDFQTVLPHLNQTPGLPLSTGGLEVLLADRVKPLLHRRQHVFSNIERTNMLFDLVVCHDRGLFLDRARVADLIRTDNEQAEGWSLPPRQVSDRMTVDADNVLHPAFSLQDATLIQSIAQKRGYI